MRISEEFGPQLDPTDGTCGDIQLVKRYVLVSGASSSIWGRRCGSRTFASEEEAEAHIAAIKENNRPEMLPADLRADAWWCWPGHHDPAARSDEGNKL